MSTNRSVSLLEIFDVLADAKSWAFSHDIFLLNISL